MINQINQVGVKHAFKLNIVRQNPNKKSPPLVFLVITQKGSLPQYINFEDLKNYHPHLLIDYLVARLNINGIRYMPASNHQPQLTELNKQINELSLKKRSFTHMSQSLNEADSIHLGSQAQDSQYESSQEQSDQQHDESAEETKANKAHKSPSKARNSLEECMKVSKKIKTDELIMQFPPPIDPSMRIADAEEPSGTSVMLNEGHNILDYDDFLKIRNNGQVTMNYIKPAYLTWPHSLFDNLVKQKNPNYRLRLFQRGNKAQLLPPLPLKTKIIVKGRKKLRKRLRK